MAWLLHAPAHPGWEDIESTDKSKEPAAPLLPKEISSLPGPDPIKPPDLLQMLTALSPCEATCGSSLLRSCVTPVKPR